ncbi:MAG: sugar nucleotide-binding protein [Gammaproteobacteria bacterium]|nr:sugar nucleotide-binding protein [Gammaproteobacteria bacterium]
MVINAIAYTAVDKAETDQEQAFLLNADLPAALADHCEQLNSLLIHYSTDFVFDGTNDKPYQVNRSYKM